MLQMVQCGIHCMVHMYVRYVLGRMRTCLPTWKHGRAIHPLGCGLSIGASTAALKPCVSACANVHCNCCMTHYTRLHRRTSVHNVPRRLQCLAHAVRPLCHLMTHCVHKLLLQCALLH